MRPATPDQPGPTTALFDDLRGRFGPLTHRRPVYALRTGALTTRQRIAARRGFDASALFVPDPLAGVCATREPDTPVNEPPRGHGPVLFLNARWPAADDSLWAAVDALPVDHALTHGHELLAAHLSPHHAQRFDPRGPLDDLPLNVTRIDTPHNPRLYARPWDLLNTLDETLTRDLTRPPLAALPAFKPDAARYPGVVVLGEHTLRIHPSATVLPHVVFNTTLGPITLDAGVTVQPFCVIEGPAYLGPQTELAAHTAVRSTTVIGPMCKVGGEVKASIIHGYSNKAHAGYLGNAIVGAWCNLGADTNVSNLKNTYGPVRMRLDDDSRTEDTGRTFQGPLLGDFVRTAIGTRLVTGSVISTGCSVVLSSLAPRFLPPMRFVTDAGDMPYDEAAFFAAAEAMMSRRHIPLTDADRALLRSLMR